MTTQNAAPQIGAEPADPFDRMFLRMRRNDLRARALWHDKPADTNKRLRRQCYLTADVTVAGVALRVSVEGNLWRTWTEHRPLGYETARNAHPMPVMRNVVDTWFVKVLGATAAGVEILPLLSEKVLTEIRLPFVARFEAELEADEEAQS